MRSIALAAALSLCLTLIEARNQYGRIHADSLRLKRHSTDQEEGGSILQYWYVPLCAIAIIYAVAYKLCGETKCVKKVNKCLCPKEKSKKKKKLGFDSVSSRSSYSGHSDHDDHYQRCSDSDGRCSDGAASAGGCSGGS